MTTAQRIRQLAGDLLDVCPWTAEDYGGDAETFAHDLLIEHQAELRRLSDDDRDFLAYTLTEMAGADQKKGDERWKRH
jgi:hypothetical protein